MQLETAYPLANRRAGSLMAAKIQKYKKTKHEIQKYKATKIQAETGCHLGKRMAGSLMAWQRA